MFIHLASLKHANIFCKFILRYLIVNKNRKIGLKIIGRKKIFCLWCRKILSKFLSICPNGGSCILRNIIGIANSLLTSGLAVMNWGYVPCGHLLLNVNILFCNKVNRRRFRKMFYSQNFVV
jgi:hypothetical protein